MSETSDGGRRPGLNTPPEGADDVSHGRPLVAVEGLTVTYPGRRRSMTIAVDEVTLSVPAGRTVGLVGESGSGKSSLGNALLGLVPVERGRVIFDGEDITHAPRDQRRLLTRRMQVIFQDPFGSMNSVRTVGDTLTEGLRFNLGLGRAETDARVERSLADVGLSTTVLQRYPGQFSGGQLQRISIARAIAMEPDFLVCDEAVSALDLSVQAQVLNVLAQLQAERGLAYLFISHDLSVVGYLADMTAVMYGGRVVEHGPASAIATSPAHPYTQMLVASAPVPDPREQAVRRHNRLNDVPADRSPVATTNACSFAARCPFAQDLCRRSRPPLEVRADGRAVACHRYDDLHDNAGTEQVTSA